jgi:hypothetical protein
MTLSTFTAGSAPAPESFGAYVRGVCNIGPAEIARRRRAGHVGLLAAIGLLAVLILIDAPPLARLLVILPATISASGYLQAWLKFCAGLGSRGLFNFGPLGSATAVTDREALERDRRRSRQIGLLSFGIGIVASVFAVFLPF